MKQAYNLLILLAATLPGWHNAMAQQVTGDPTRPPAAILSGTPDAAVGGSLLQSVIITATQRAAIIGGERVNLGGKYGDARVVKITENEVVLHSATGAETLRLYPGVEVKPVESGDGTKLRKTRKAPARHHVQERQE
jgi:MSHA biogenesis protein MshK